MKYLYCFLVIFYGCSISKTTIKREYYSLSEARKYYDLNNEQLRKIIKMAKKGDIKIIYHAGRDEWMYDANFDFSSIP